MKLTPMVKLMQDAGAEGFANTVMIETDALEQLRQAIISDFVNGLDAAGWKLFDGFYHSHDEAKSSSRNWTVQPTPLFDLSEWRNK